MTPQAASGGRVDPNPEARAHDLEGECETGPLLDGSERGAGPLEGFRVLEVGSLIAGPFAGRLLADLGAEVIKIEPPDKPDPFREWGHGRYRDRTLWWPVQSRNKKLITLDLRRGPELFLRLAELSDVVIENFRPGTLERWGVGYERLQARNAGLVLVRVSGYGQTGPGASRGGFAAVAEAVSGLRSLNGYPDQPPPRTGISLGDSLGGLYAAIGALAALLHRVSATGRRGQVVDVSLLESCLAMLESAIPEYDRLGIVRKPSGSRLNGLAPSNIFRTADDRWIVIAANQDALFARLCEQMGRPELITDSRFATHQARGEHQDEIESIVAEWASTLPAAQIDTVLSEAGVVCGPVNTVADVVEDEQLRSRGAFVVQEDPELGEFLAPGVVPAMSDTPGKVRWSGPWQPGAHNEEVFAGLLGLTDDEREHLKRDGVI